MASALKQRVLAMPPGRRNALSLGLCDCGGVRGMAWFAQRPIGRFSSRGWMQGRAAGIAGAGGGWIPYEMTADGRECRFRRRWSIRPYGGAGEGMRRRDGWDSSCSTSRTGWERVR